MLCIRQGDRDRPAGGRLHNHSQYGLGSLGCRRYLRPTSCRTAQRQSSVGPSQASCGRHLQSSRKDRQFTEFVRSHTKCTAKHQAVSTLVFICVVFTDVPEALAMRTVDAHSSCYEVAFGPQRLVVYPIEHRIAATEVGQPNSATSSVCSSRLCCGPQ